MSLSFGNEKKTGTKWCAVEEESEAVRMMGIRQVAVKIRNLREQHSVHRVCPHEEKWFVGGTAGTRHDDGRKKICDGGSCGPTSRSA